MKPANACENLAEVRHEIDLLDRELISLLARRLEYVKRVAAFKKTEEEVIALHRLNTVIEQRRSWAAEAGINPAVIEKIYRELIHYFIEEEKKVLGLS